MNIVQYLPVISQITQIGHFASQLKADSIKAVKIAVPIIFALGGAYGIGATIKRYQTPNQHMNEFSLKNYLTVIAIGLSVLGNCATIARDSRKTAIFSLAAQLIVGSVGYLLEGNLNDG